MKIRSDFVTNSSSSSYLVVYGDIEKGLIDIEDFREVLNKFLLEDFLYDVDMLSNGDYVNIYCSTYVIGGIEVETYKFSVAMGVPYEISIKQCEEDFSNGLSRFGYNVLYVSSDIEERWE